MVASYFAPTQTLTLTNAGHPSPALYDANSGHWSFLTAKSTDDSRPTNIPLGVLHDSDYAAHERCLHAGDIVVCYTDALIECRNGKGDILGEEGLMRVLQQLDTDRPSQLIPTLLRALSGLCAGNLKGDDVTVLLFTPNSLFEHAYQVPTLKTHLAIMKKIFRAMLAKGEPVPWPDLHPANMGGAIFNALNKLWGRKLK